MRIRRPLSRAADFIEIRTAELSKQSKNAADALAGSPTEHGFQEAAVRGNEIGNGASELLDALHSDPGNSNLATNVAHELSSLSDRASSAEASLLSKVFQIALGVVAALGGFVDIGELVFNSQAGAEFGYQLLWTVPIGVVGIATYAEMCGRVATGTKRPVFDVVRQRLGFGPGLVTHR